MKAVIETGSKQYFVEVGKKIKIEKLNVKEGETVFFDKVLLIFDGAKTNIGAPYIQGAKAEGAVLKQDRENKKIVFRYKAKVRRRKKKGHRQPFTEIKITNIQ